MKPSDENNQDESEEEDTPETQTSPKITLKTVEGLDKEFSDDPEISTPELTPLEIAREESIKLKDQVLRLAADMENLRRRTEREKQDMAKYAISNFARDVLTVDDNLSRALSAVPEGAVEKDPALKALVDGVGMTSRELVNVFERNGIKRVDPKGDIFDPNLHQAMFELPNPDVPAGTIMEVIACGFMIDARVLRPAMVGIAKGGEKPKKEDPTTKVTKDQNAKKDENIDKSV